VTDIRQDTPVYPIGVVRKLTALTDRQIRYYEQVGLLQPARTPGQRRMYSPNEVELLLRIKHEMDRGLSTSEIRARIKDGSRHTPLSSPAMRRLPHFAGGEQADHRDPDVEARRAFMTERSRTKR